MIIRPGPQEKLKEFLHDEEKGYQIEIWIYRNNGSGEKGNYWGGKGTPVIL